MGNNIIFIPIELPVRELSSSAMLASYLSSKGMKVVIGSQLHIKNLALNSKKTIYLDKTLYSAHNNFYSNLSKKNIKIFCDDIEASGCHVPEIYAQARFSQKNIDLAKGIFFWGKDDFSAVKKYYDISDTKCFKRGSFRTFFWKNYSQNIPSNIKKMNALKEKYGDFVFIPSNFGGSMRSDGTKGVINQVKINYPHLLDKIQKRIDHIEKRRELFMSDLIKIADCFENINFVFRPHPNEEIYKWIKILPKRKNLFIEYEGSVTEYIMASNVVLHSGCTSAFEAYFYKKPCIAHVPRKNKKWDSWQANFMSEETENFSSLEKKLNHLLIHKSEFKNINPFYELKDDLLEYYFKAFNENDLLTIKEYKNEMYKLNSHSYFNSIKNTIKYLSDNDFRYSDRKFSKENTFELKNKLEYFNKEFNADSVHVKNINDKVLMLL